MKPEEINEENIREAGMTRSGTRRIGSLEGQDFIDADYDIDEYNGKIADIFGDWIKSISGYIY